MTSDPAVVAEGVSYRIGAALLVSDVDFTAHAGELVAVIGPNGAGKSTLLNLLAGSLRPTSGRVMLNGTDTNDSTPRDLALVRAVLTQRTPIDIPHTAYQVVAMGRFPHRSDQSNTGRHDAAVVAAAMEFTDTTQFGDRIFATLSGGERTRVSLARVLAQETEIVLLDEPTTALDIAHQERIMQTSRDLAGRGRAVVTVLHDLNAAAVYADRIVLLAGGGVAADGSAREVLDAQLLSNVYGQPMVVVDHPFRDCPLVLPTDPPGKPDPDVN